jgi:hypothetical protein
MTIQFCDIRDKEQARKPGVIPVMPRPRTVACALCGTQTPYHLPYPINETICTECDKEVGAAIKDGTL